MKQLLVVIQALEAIEAESSDKLITLKSKWLNVLRRLGDFDFIFALGVALRLFGLATASADRRVMYMSFQCQSHSLQLNTLKRLIMAHE